MIVNLNDGYAQEVEISDAPELLKQILWQEVPGCILWGNDFVIWKILAVIVGWWRSTFRDGIVDKYKPIASSVPSASSLRYFSNSMKTNI